MNRVLVGELSGWRNAKGSSRGLEGRYEECKVGISNPE